jgi:hypothetical protein
MNNGQEATYLEHPPIIQENQMDWEMAVIKVSKVIEDTCKEYDDKGHPYYSEFLRQAFQRIVKG